MRHDLHIFNKEKKMEGIQKAPPIQEQERHIKTLISFLFKEMKEYEIDTFNGFGMTVERKSLELERERLANLDKAKKVMTR